MEKPLAPPPPVYDQFKPRDSFIARVTDLRPIVADDPFQGCKNGSERLLKMLELADAQGPMHGNAVLARTQF